MGNYWTETEDDLCHRWVVASTEKEYQSIYLKLSPKIRKMIEAILNRYLIYNHSLFDDYVSDILIHTFTNLYKYDEKKRGKNGWYSYVQTIIKNYAINMVRVDSSKSDNVSFDDYLKSVGDVYDNNESKANQIERLKNDVVFMLSKEKLKVESSYKKEVEKRAKIGSNNFNTIRKYGGKTDSQLKYMKNEIVFLDMVIDYMLNHSNYNLASLVIYLSNNTEMQDRYIKSLISKHFGFRYNSNIRDLRKYK